MKNNLTQYKIAAFLLLLLSPACQDIATTNALSKTEILSLSSVFNESSSMAFSANPGYGYSEFTLKIGNGFYASNVCTGKNVLGLAGTALCNACYTDFYSGAFRGAGSTRLTSSQEGSLYSGEALPDNYHTVPLIRQDDEGACTPDLPSTTCNLRTRIGAIPSNIHNAYVPCGITQATIELRIADCAQKNGPGWAQWDGHTQGTGAEGVWKLVTVAENSGAPPYKEVWLDMKSGHLWSSRTASPVPTSPPLSPYTDEPAPWCSAAGNDNNCDPASTRPCATPNKDYCVHNQTSYCAEVLYPTPRPSPSPVIAGTSFIGEKFDYAASVYSGAKGKMGLYSTPSVFWRLPSLNEYDVADVNGIRNVMADMGGRAGINDLEWTATLDSFSSLRKNAFAFSSMKGTVSSQPRTNTNIYARCIAPAAHVTAHFSNVNNTATTSAYYSKVITFNTTAPTLPASSLPVTLDTAVLISSGKLNASCSNLKFIAADGVTAVPYFLESGNCNSASSLFWLRVPGFTTSTTVHFIYGGLTPGVAPNSATTFPTSYTATGTTGVITGTNYDSFVIPAGTSVTAATGTVLSITAPRMIIDGTLNLSAKGYPGATTGVTGGSGPGGAPSSAGFGAGGGHAGAGGCPVNAAGTTCLVPSGGVAYGLDSAVLDSSTNALGSGGSSGADFGQGYGGGAMVLVAKIFRMGASALLSANGQDGFGATGVSLSQGGGAGGTIYLSADQSMTLGGTLSVIGGKPRNTGGGGSGGRIKLISPGATYSGSPTLSVAGASTTISAAPITVTGATGANGGVYQAAITNPTTSSVGAEVETLMTP